MKKMTDLMMIEKAIAYANGKHFSDLGLRVGAVATTEDAAIFGTNHMAFAGECTPEILNNRTERLKRVVHAETDAINGSFYQIKSLHCNYHPCLDCSKKIVAAGIKKVVFATCLIPGVVESWKESWDKGTALMEAAGVEVVEVRVPYDRWEDQMGTMDDDGNPNFTPEKNKY
jgi:deoxycytidylate deaminase